MSATNYLLSLSLCFFMTLQSDAQSPSFKYGFNDCTGEAVGAVVPGITILGSPPCICGPKGSSYNLDGIDQSFRAPSLINPGFKEDFTFDFYFTNPFPLAETHLMYVGTCASIDSLMRLRYFEDSDDYLFEISGSVNNFFTAKFKVDKSKCWHRFTLVKFDLEYFLYINSRLVTKFLARETILFPKNRGISFGANPCVGVSGGNLKGSIDEISFLNKASSEQQVVSSDLYVDRIVSPPVTIFKGESVDLTLGESCGSIIWAPATSLNRIDSILVTATPLETTIYTATSANSFCGSKDSVTIYVADKDELDCSNLLLPSAFTPNGDSRNDIYKIDNTFIVEQLELFEIYASNGAKVWGTNDISDGWDGTMNGGIQAAGTYLYKIKYRCNNESYISSKAFVLLR